MFFSIIWIVVGLLFMVGGFVGIHEGKKINTQSMDFTGPVTFVGWVCLIGGAVVYFRGVYTLAFIFLP